MFKGLTKISEGPGMNNVEKLDLSTHNHQVQVGMLPELEYITALDEAYVCALLLGCLYMQS